MIVTRAVASATTSAAAATVSPFIRRMFTETLNMALVPKHSLPAVNITDDIQPGLKDTDKTDLVFSYALIVIIFGAFAAIVFADFQRKHRRTRPPQDETQDRRNIVQKSLDSLRTKLSPRDCWPFRMFSRKKKSQADIENVAERDFSSQAIIERLAARPKGNNDDLSEKEVKQPKTHVEVILTPEPNFSSDASLFGTTPVADIHQHDADSTASATVVSVAAAAVPADKDEDHQQVQEPRPSSVYSINPVAIH